MKHGGRVMLAVAGGYFLGRTKKMKLAIMLAGVASGNKIARDPTQLLAQGTRLVQSNPQLSALSDQVRGRLVEAGKGVAVAVVSRQMDALSDRLSERTDRLSGRLDEDDLAGDPAADESDDAPGAPSAAVTSARQPAGASTPANGSAGRAPRATRQRSSGRSQGGGGDA